MCCIRATRCNCASSCLHIPGSPLTTAPYAVTWSSQGVSAVRPHMVTVRATDLLGRSAVSGLVALQVDNGPSISAVAMSPGLTATSARITIDIFVPISAISGNRINYFLGSYVESKKERVAHANPLLYFTYIKTKI